MKRLARAQARRASGAPRARPGTPVDWQDDCIDAAVRENAASESTYCVESSSSRFIQELWSDTSLWRTTRPGRLVRCSIQGERGPLKSVPRKLRFPRRLVYPA